MLLRQYEYEDPIVRGGKHLLHSAFFKELVALACHLGLDSLPCCSETYKWAWFRYYIITELIFFIGKKNSFSRQIFLKIFLFFQTILHGSLSSQCSYQTNYSTSFILCRCPKENYRNVLQG